MIAFAHLSDLHFGAILANERKGWVPKQRPHDWTKCLALPAAMVAVADLMDTPGEGVDLPLVVSGDLTVSGAGPELAVAHAFLRSRPAIGRLPGHLGLMGMGRHSEHLAVIPGNHDHWGGHRATLPPFNGTALYEKHFRATPWRKCFASNDNKLTLELFGVDSNSGWAPDQASLGDRRLGGVLAQGRISKPQLDALAKMLAKPEPVQGWRVRAVVCHHSLHHRGGLSHTGELHSSSRERLLQLCVDHGVSALLTGHTHDVLMRTHARANATGRTLDTHELRSAHSVGFGRGGDAADPREVGFLSHRISQQPTGLRWEAWRWYWHDDGRNKGYRVRQRQPDHSFAVAPA